MTENDLDTLFDAEAINKILPETLADRFFDALYGDPAEGAYNIGLKFKEQTGNTLVFEFHLTLPVNMFIS